MKHLLLSPFVVVFLDRSSVLNTTRNSSASSKVTLGLEYSSKYRTPALLSQEFNFWSITFPNTLFQKLHFRYLVGDFGFSICLFIKFVSFWQLTSQRPFIKLSQRKLLDMYYYIEWRRMSCCFFQQGIFPLSTFNRPSWLLD